MISDYFTTSFTTNRVSSSVDENNFDIQTDVTNLTSKGFFEPLTGRERIYNDKYEATTTHRLFTPVLDIVESDTIIINTLSYNVDLIQNYMDRHLEIYLIQRK